MSNGNTAINLWLSPLELNFLQVAVDDLIDMQRGLIHDFANQSADFELQQIYEAVDRLRTGLNLKATLEDA